MGNVTIKGIAHAVREMFALRKRIKEPKPALKRIGTYMVGLSNQAFRDEADPTHHRPWAALAPSTISARARKGKGPHPILMMTSKLRNSVHWMITGKQSVAAGTNLKKAPPLFSGRKSISMPGREFVGIDREGLVQTTRIMREYLDTGR